jgi:archaellum component FlaC
MFSNVHFLEPRTGALQSTSLQDAQDKIADLESKYKVLMDKVNHVTLSCNNSSYGILW